MEIELRALNLAAATIASTRSTNYVAMHAFPARCSPLACVVLFASDHLPSTDSTHIHAPLSYCELHHSSASDALPSAWIWFTHVHILPYIGFPAMATISSPQLRSSAVDQSPTFGARSNICCDFLVASSLSAALGLSATAGGRRDDRSYTAPISPLSSMRRQVYLLSNQPSQTGARSAVFEA